MAHARALLAALSVPTLSLALSGCASSEPDPRVAPLEKELEQVKAERDRLVTEATKEANTAKDELVAQEREVARLMGELGASRASTAALQLASDSAMDTVRRQEAELVKLRGAAPVESAAPAGDGTELGAALELLRQKSKEIATLQEALAAARNPDLVGAPKVEGRVRVSNLDLEVPVATVDGQPVARREFIEFLYRDMASPQLLDLLVNRLLVLREAKRRELTVTDVDVAVWVQEQLVDQTKEAGSPERLEERLKKGGFTRESWEARLRYQGRPVILVRRLIEQDRQTAAGKEAFEARIRARYAQAYSDKVSARHILVAAAQDAPSDEVAAARHKAEALRDLLARGQPFADVARRSSDDPDRKLGGQLGKFDRTRFAACPELNTAFFTLAPGTLSEPIRSARGFELVLVDQRYAPEKGYDAETRTKLAREVSAEPPSEDEQEALLGRLRAEAHVSQSLVFD